MRTIRIYAPFEKALPGQRLILTDLPHHHIAHVLRLKVGQSIRVFNGKAAIFEATLEKIEKKSSHVLLTQSLEPTPESPLQLHLAQGICRGERMDFVLQKATELGVTSITPLFSERVAVYWEPDRYEKKLAHWNNVIISACEQSGRDTLPILNPPLPFDRFLAQLTSPVRFLLSPQATAPLHLTPPASEATLMIGPEGGFSDKEIQLATELGGFQLASLGPRILRTETAGLTALSILQYLGGDLGKSTSRP